MNTFKPIISLRTSRQFLPYADDNLISLAQLKERDRGEMLTSDDVVLMCNSINLMEVFSVNYIFRILLLDFYLSVLTPLSHLYFHPPACPVNELYNIGVEGGFALS